VRTGAAVHVGVDLDIDDDAEAASEGAAHVVQSAAAEGFNMMR